MTKQEEIKWGIVKVAQNTYFKHDHDTVWYEMAKEILAFLHSKGVVIVVEREFPEHVLPETVMATYAQGYLNGQTTMIKAGYVFTEPLIKEKE